MAKKALELLTESMFYVLLALDRRDLCGTDVADYIVGKTKGRIRMGPGTLYTILNKFEDEKLIAETSVEGRKRTYTMTYKGKAAYRAEIDRLRLCLADAESEDV